MKINQIRILTDVLDNTSTHITRINGRFALVEDNFEPELNIVAQHEDWSKFLWLCGEWYKSQQQKESQQ